MFKILYANDLHFCGDSKNPYPKAETSLPVFFSFLEKRRKEFDLLIFGGDLVNSGSIKNDELKKVHNEIKKIGLPFFAIAGNHDIAPQMDLNTDFEKWENCSLDKTNFGQVFGEKSIRCTYIVNGIKLIFFSIRNEDPDGQLLWLDEELSDGISSMIFCHYPLTLTRKGGFCSKWGYQRLKDSRLQLIEMIKKRDNQILAYFSGHHHLNSRVKIGQTEQIVTGSLGLATCCFRIINITNTAIEISTHRLPDIPNWLEDVMNPKDSTDAEHKDLESYHWGNEYERNFTIQRL